MTMDWTATMLDAAGVAADPALSARRRVAAAGAGRSGAGVRAPALLAHEPPRPARAGPRPWKYLRVDGHDYLFDLDADERERANRAAREPARLPAMRADWEAWNATMPPIPADATVSLGYGAKDMPQR